MSVLQRLHLGLAVLIVLFVTFLVVHFAVGGRLRADHELRADRLATARLANDRLLQHMTDAETGVRGYQLTADRSFLAPYESGRSGAAAALDEVAAGTDEDTVRRILDRERAVVTTWLREYAAPVVSAARPETDEAAAARGKRMFDELRMVNEAVSEAVDAERRAAEHAAVRAERLVTGVSVALLGALLAVAFAVVRIGSRQLLTPLDQLGRTIRRLAGGDRSARAEPVGAVELRAVVDALNDLAAQTEELLAREQARSARAGLRLAVAAALQDLREPAAAVRRITELIGTGLGVTTAGAVHCGLVVPGTGPVRAHWPATAAELAGTTVTELLTNAPGEIVTFPGGALGVTIGGDTDCETGFLWVSRPELAAGAAGASAPGASAAGVSAADGEPGWTDAERRLLTGVAGAIERVLRQLTLQHRQARLITELRILDQRKDVFIQTVTHELRTPLTSILGYTEMLSEDAGNLSPVQQRSLNAINRNAYRLHQTIGDLVLLDRPDTAEVRTEPIDLAELATTVHTELANAARAKELTVGFEAAEGWVLGDRVQLQRALRKLMENAIKFTPAGGSVRCALTADPDTVTVVVSDTGIGIPAEDVPGLFTPFHRAGNAMDQAVQGPGLGLAIVRDIVSDHGGSITVQSVVGGGSTFTLTLPALPAPVAATVPAL